MNQQHSKPNWLLYAFLIALYGSLTSMARSQQAYYPSRSSEWQSVNHATGYIETYFDGSAYRGSGVVARHPNLLYSCAHLTWDKELGKWMTSMRFFRGLHSQTRPAKASGALMRGTRIFVGYNQVKSDTARAAGKYDFTVSYSNTPLGTPVQYFPEMGGQRLSEATTKEIIGYPSEIVHNGAQGYRYQHRIGSIAVQAVQLDGGLYSLANTTSGPGMSGAPVFAWHQKSDGDWVLALAGVHVIGNPIAKSIGIRALDLAADSLASNALDQLSLPESGNVKMQTNRRRFQLTDGARKFKKRTVTVRGLSTKVKSIRLSLTFNAKRKSDLDVILRSPSGKMIWIWKGKGGNAKNLKIRNKEISKFFRGKDPNGTWTLFMRDKKSKNRSFFNNFRLTFHQ